MESAQTIPNPITLDPLSFERRTLFDRDGFVVLRSLTNQSMIERMLRVTMRDRENRVEPIEYEFELNYPGAPNSIDEDGGKTIRRLKQAHARDSVFTEWMNSPELKGILRELLGPELVCPLAHHDCIMTKEPQFSSDTGWHQDIRYWSFGKPELISVWLALGKENLENGCLQVIPGSHRMRFQQHQFDENLFFRTDLEDNQTILNQCVPVELAPGDVLFFHCRTLHSASRNHTKQTKNSVVFTFRSLDNPPLSGTRSAASPEILLH